MIQLSRLSMLGSISLCLLSLMGFGLLGCDASATPHSPHAAKSSDRSSPANDIGLGESRPAPVAEAAPAANKAGKNLEAAAPAVKVAVATIKPSKAATTMPADSNVTGTVTFTQDGDKVIVVADVSGLEPNTKHGFHIHDKGDLSAPDLASAGGHWNPDHHVHGGPSTSPVHAGDMGNLVADASGKAHLELLLTGVSVGGGKNDVVGHSVIIHAKPDDLSSQPAGNSGPRVAGGVIELQDAK